MADAQANPPELFPNDRPYEMSSRSKLDTFVRTFLAHHEWDKQQERVQVWTPGNVKWFHKNSLNKLLRWVCPPENKGNAGSEEDEEMSEKLKSVKLNSNDDQVDVEQAQPNAEPVPNSQQIIGPLDKIQFCEHFYHVRHFELTDMAKNYQQCQARPTPAAEIPLEHSPEADGCCYGRLNKRDEPKCVGALAAVEFESGKLIMHFTHNERNCTGNPRYGDGFQHAEMRLLDDLEDLFTKCLEIVSDVCIYMLYQPCHKSVTEKESDKETKMKESKKRSKKAYFSCCEEIIEYLQQFNSKLPLRFKVAYFHRLHWNPQGASQREILNAMQGMELLNDHEISVCAMSKDDWENIWKTAVNHTV